MSGDLWRVALPPRNIEAEQNLLGAMLKSARCVPAAIESIPAAEFFYDDRHRLVFATLQDMFRERKGIDLTTAADALRQRKQLEAVGGTLYLTQLMNTVPASLNVEEYARIVREKYLLRQLIQVGTDLTAGGFRDSEPPQNLMNAAQKQICELAAAEDGAKLVPAKTLVHRVVDEMESIHKQKGGWRGLRTGFRWLDHHTGGLKGGDLLILAARPSMGKTALALNIATRIAFNRDEQNQELNAGHDGLPVLIFSLEMSAESLLQRVICSEARINWNEFNRGITDSNAFVRITDAASLLTQCELQINDSSAITPLEITAQARRLKTEKKKLGLIVIDYLQQMQADTGGRRGGPENRQQEIAAISRQLKGLARDLDVPVLALSQLSRQVEHREDKRPGLSDLRESGALEQDADVVLMLYREEYYLKRLNKPVPPEALNTAELIIAKQRNGVAGINGRLTFYGDYTRFETQENPDEQPGPEAEYVPG